MEQRKRLATFFILVVVIGITSFAVFNSRQFFEGPLVTIYSPESGSSFEEPTIILQGKAVNTAFIKLNGHPVYINEENEFNEKLLLPPGTSIMKLEATDRFERKVEHTLWYTYNGSIPDIGTSSQIMIQPVATSSIEITE